MSQYYFHVTDGQNYQDDYGVILSSLAAARQEALRFTGEFIKDATTTFWDGGEWSMRVADAANLTLFTMTVFSTNAPALSNYNAT